ncbi:MAG TPA: ImmA/IrrE family metallo-endopeptidase [Armatimonadota bacterium]|jgi:Zn-dependent peptidase ImmA (M78 family)
MRRGFKQDAEREALAYRKTLSLAGHMKLPAADLAKHLGIRIITPRDVPGLSAMDLSRLLEADEGSWSGVTLTRAGFSIIICNPSHSLRRQESDIMHELAHLICRHDPATRLDLRDCPFFLRTYDQAQEDEANWLGGALQVPRAGLVWAMVRKMDKQAMALHFGASEQMVEFRCRMTGIRKQIPRACAKR